MKLDSEIKHSIHPSNPINIGYLRHFLLANLLECNSQAHCGTEFYSKNFPLSFANSRNVIYAFEEAPCLANSIRADFPLLLK